MLKSFIFIFFLLVFPIKIVAFVNVTNQSMLLQAWQDIKMSVECQTISTYTQTVSPSLLQSIKTNEFDESLFFSVFIDTLLKRDFKHLSFKKIKIIVSSITPNIANASIDVDITIKAENRKETIEKKYFVKLKFKENINTKRWALIRFDNIIKK